VVYNNDRFFYREFINNCIPAMQNEVRDINLLGVSLYPAGQYAELDVNKKWKMIPLKDMGVWNEETVDEFPVCSKLIQFFGDKCRSAGISILEPGGKVLTHTDTEEGHELYVIVHAPLIVPEGDVGFKEGNIEGKWIEGESFILDVETPHSIWNFTETPRIILLLEILKEHAYV
jgi:aspartyl/asparaginyl beta-hydroxylase (cupin superfamily)